MCLFCGININGGFSKNVPAMPILECNPKRKGAAAGAKKKKDGGHHPFSNLTKPFSMKKLHSCFFL